MRDNQFYQRLNQIRTKYGYSNQNQEIKQANLSFYKPQLAHQSYRDTLVQKEPSHQPSTPQRTYAKNYKIPQIQQKIALGNSPNGLLTKQRNLNNHSLRVQEKNNFKQQHPQIPTNFTENEWFQKSKLNYTNTLNESLSPSPIKKFNAEYALKSSPVRKGQISQKTGENQALRPYNRGNNQATDIGQLQTLKQKEQIMKRQRDSAYTEAINNSNNMQIKSLRGEISFQNQVAYSARSSNGSNQVKYKQGFELQQNFNKDQSFLQKFNHNVKNIQKIQDKINLALNRQK